MSTCIVLEGSSLGILEATRPRYCAKSEFASGVAKLLDAKAMGRCVLSPGSKIQSFLGSKYHLLESQIIAIASDA